MHTYNDVPIFYRYIFRSLCLAEYGPKV